MEKMQRLIVSWFKSLLLFWVKWQIGASSFHFLDLIINSLHFLAYVSYSVSSTNVVLSETI